MTSKGPKNGKHQSWYGNPRDYGTAANNDETGDETVTLLLLDPEIGEKKVNRDSVSHQDGSSSTGQVIQKLFLQGSATDWYDLHTHPMTHPKRAPITRYARHRNPSIYQLNQFRHWWKTSRLLVRVSGGYEYCINKGNWIAMGMYNVTKHKQAKMALKSVKGIGRGGPSADFLAVVQPFTRSIRIILAVARGWEAKVDNRFVEVLLAEAFAFMGNRCSRWFAREFVIVLSKVVMFPYVGGLLLEPHLTEQHSRPLIVAMGFLRAILPFALSFQGSRIGRQLTYNTYTYACFRWRPVQTLAHFHPNAGVYQDTILDEELQTVAQSVAMAIGHGQNPVTTHERMAALGFFIVGCGQGGYAVYRKTTDTGKEIIVHVTPYGPSILDEMPRYIVVERKVLPNSPSPEMKADTKIGNASILPEATVAGFTYSGAFFTNQEWAALTNRFNETLECYGRACRTFGTVNALQKGGRDHGAILMTPSDLSSLKAFIRTGRTSRKNRRDRKRKNQLDAEIKTLSNLVATYQRRGVAPKRIILYLEGLDCSAKSSTGGLIFTALEGCGYTVRTAQHNRPPNEEQRRKPWMDRSRFEYPQDVFSHGLAEGEDIPEYTALVWDRGPAGDFVYGTMGSLHDTEKQTKYDEFRSYDTQSRQEGVLFCKLLFVADRDSIASTLGKRLAHKKIARDLRTWLDANASRMPQPDGDDNDDAEHEGLKEIERHIDPTDFVAFNKYHENLSIFTEFARHTDNIREQPSPIDGTQPGYHNPWTVVNTANRHPARLALLRTFERQLISFTKDQKKGTKSADPSSSTTGGKMKKKPWISLPYLRDDAVFHFFVEDKVDAVLSLRAWFQIFLLFLLFCFYLHGTWKVDFSFTFDHE